MGGGGGGGAYRSNPETASTDAEVIQTIRRIIPIIPIIDIVPTPHMPYMLYSATDPAPIPHQNRCTEGGGWVELTAAAQKPLYGLLSRTASGSGPQ